jgi:hypothetical protein
MSHKKQNRSNEKRNKTNRRKNTIRKDTKKNKKKNTRRNRTNKRNKTNRRRNIRRNRTNKRNKTNRRRNRTNKRKACAESVTKNVQGGAEVFAEALLSNADKALMPATKVLVNAAAKLPLGYRRQHSDVVVPRLPGYRRQHPGLDPSANILARNRKVCCKNELSHYVKIPTSEKAPDGTIVPVNLSIHAWILRHGLDTNDGSRRATEYIRKFFELCSLDKYGTARTFFGPVQTYERGLRGTISPTCFTNTNLILIKNHLKGIIEKDPDYNMDPLDLDFKQEPHPNFSLLDPISGEDEKRLDEVKEEIRKIISGAIPAIVLSELAMKEAMDAVAGRTTIEISAEMDHVKTFTSKWGETKSHVPVYPAYHRILGNYIMAMTNEKLAKNNKSDKEMIIQILGSKTIMTVEETNRDFDVIEHGGDPFTISLDVGKYHPLQLQDHLREKLNNASKEWGVGYTYRVAFNNKSSKFTFSINTNGNGDVMLTQSSATKRKQLEALTQPDLKIEAISEGFTQKQINVSARGETWEERKKGVFNLLMGRLDYNAIKGKTGVNAFVFPHSTGAGELLGFTEAQNEFQDILLSSESFPTKDAGNVDDVDDVWMRLKDLRIKEFTIDEEFVEQMFSSLKETVKSFTSDDDKENLRLLIHKILNDPDDPADKKIVEKLDKTFPHVTKAIPLDRELMAAAPKKGADLKERRWLEGVAENKVLVREMLTDTDWLALKRERVYWKNGIPIRFPMTQREWTFFVSMLKGEDKIRTEENEERLASLLEERLAAAEAQEQDETQEQAEAERQRLADETAWI